MAPFLTIGEKLANSDTVVLVKWQNSRKGDSVTFGTTKFEISQVVKSAKASLKQGGSVLLTKYLGGKKGDLYLLLGRTNVNIDWEDSVAVSLASFKYLTNSPGLKEPTAKRLKYFIKYLEHSDPVIALDAYAEFAHARFKDIKKIAKHVPRDRMRKLVSNQKTPGNRLGLFGLLLGICGKK